MQKPEIIYIGGDHAGFDLKHVIIKHLEANNYTVKDLGPHSSSSVDYPDFAHPLSELVAQGNSLGILICGSGNGVCMTANKNKAIRAALCWQPVLAALARQHNNANVLCIPARFIDETTALKTVDRFMESEFEGGRHKNRVEKI